MNSRFQVESKSPPYIFIAGPWLKVKFRLKLPHSPGVCFFMACSKSSIGPGETGHDSYGFLHNLTHFHFFFPSAKVSYLVNEVCKSIMNPPRSHGKTGPNSSNREHTIQSLTYSSGYSLFFPYVLIPNKIQLTNERFNILAHLNIYNFHFSNEEIKYCLCILKIVNSGFSSC